MAQSKEYTKELAKNRRDHLDDIEIQKQSGKVYRSMVNRLRKAKGLKPLSRYM